ncbi:MAG TPA: hypothetical protein VKR83_04245 [Ktedonobacteraceae bacterium]|nr:hypothetical protein [Ktedonobacteraceae bacterium]
MSTHQENGNTSIDSYERYARHLSRQVILSEKRNRTTDVLPAIISDAAVGKLSTRQITQLRDENRRLRREVDELQRRIAEYSEIDARFEQEVDTIHKGHQLEIEQYQNHLREMMDELNQKQQALQDMEQRYQELYHSFHDAVEEEAAKLVTEAAQTMVLSPEHTPPILHDVVKTLEFQVKQTEDQHVAELLALMRQAQRKNELLEQELAQEHQKLTYERQKIYVEQNRIREQGELRNKMIAAHLRARFSLLVTLLTTGCLLLFAIVELILYADAKLPVYWSLFIPIVICAVLAYFVSLIGSHVRYFRPPQKQQSKQSGNKQPGAK